MVKTKHIIDVVLISVSLITILLLAGNITSKVIAPLNNQETNNTNVLFEIKNANYISIDDNPEFTSPEKIFLKDYLVIPLSPGTYYWKIYGGLNSEVRKLTILSNVGLTLVKQNDSSYNVVNSGTETLNVGVYDNNSLVQNFTLNPSDIVEKNGTKFIGGKI